VNGSPQRASAKSQHNSAQVLRTAPGTTRATGALLCDKVGQRVASKHCMTSTILSLTGNEVGAVRLHD